MLLIRCPWCEEDRPEIEFRYAGEAHIARSEDMAALGDDALASYLYLRSNPKGEHAERWHHIHGCGRFLNVLRDTISDRVLATYPSGASRPDATVAAASLKERGP